MTSPSSGGNSTGARLRATLREACNMLKVLDRYSEQQFVTDFLNRAEALLLVSESHQRRQFPIPLNAEQEQAAKEWAADDRLWTTQETVEFNLRTFARKILAVSESHQSDRLRAFVKHMWEEAHDGGDFERTIWASELDAVLVRASQPSEGEEEPICKLCGSAEFQHGKQGQCDRREVTT